MTVDQLNKLIKSGNLSGIFFFYGEEQYLLSNKVDAISNKLITPGTEAFNVFNFSGKGVNIDEILSTVDRFPQMSPMKLITVKNSGILNNAVTTEFKALRDFAGHFPSDTCLIFIEQEFDKKKLNNIEFIANSGGIINFEYIQINKLVIWICDKFRKYGKSISESDASYIIRLCGQSLSKLELECNKLLDFLGDRIKLTREDIDSTVSKTVEYRIYDMLDNAIAGRAKIAQEQLKYLRDTKEDPTYILSLMMSRLSELLMCKLLKEDGLNSAEISDYFDFKRPTFVVTKTIEESRRFGEKYLKRMIDKGLYYDVECKSGKLATWPAVEMYLAELVK